MIDKNKNRFVNSYNKLTNRLLNLEREREKLKLIYYIPRDFEKSMGVMSCISVLV